MTKDRRHKCEPNRTKTHSNSLELNVAGRQEWRKKENKQTKVYINIYMCEYNDVYIKTIFILSTVSVHCVCANEE